MSLKKIIFVILFITICFTNSQAALQFTLSPEIGMIGGTTEYEMDYYYEFNNYITGEPVFTVWRINSLLEFPLDSKIAGLSATLNSKYDPSRWSVFIKFQTSFTDPDEKMKDSDFEGITTFFPYTQISYTESDATLVLHIFEAGVLYRIINKNRYDVSLLVEFHYQSIYQELIGYDGWYRPFDTVLVEYFDSTVAISGAVDTVGITYKLQTEQVALGFQSNIYLTEKLTTKLKAAFTPLYFNDTDDHTLRYKVSRSSGFGLGFKGAFSLRYDLPFSNLTYIQLNSTYNKINAEGSQSQIWYEHERGIDPETQRSIILVPDGTAIASIPHEIRRIQYSINLSLGIEF